MSVRPRFHVTYEVTTPESAQHGDTADSGFIGRHGERVSLDGLWGEAAARVKERCALTLHEALAAFGDRYSAKGLEISGFDYYQADWSTDFRTGAETRLAFHIDGRVTPSSHMRVERLLFQNA